MRRSGFRYLPPKRAFHPAVVLAVGFALAAALCATGVVLWVHGIATYP